MRRIVLFLYIYMAAAFDASVGFATGCATGAMQAEPRVVLGLYDGRRELTPLDTRLHRFIEFPLNHLGYSLRYLDVSVERLPDQIDSEIAGAVTWFDAPLADPSWFARWAEALRADCPDDFSFVVLGETGLLPDRKPDATEERYLHRLGLGWKARSVLLGDFTDVALRDPKVLGYESDFVFQPGRYASLSALSYSDAALSVVPAGKTPAAGIDLVVLHHPNVYVHQSATLDADMRAPGNFWIMDPFAILGRALSRNRQMPIADVTTLNGRRIYFETVGPEGWLAPAPARTFDEEPRLGAENLLARLIRPYPDLPVTVSVVVGDLDQAIGGKPAQRGRRAAAQIFALAHTAVATSGRSLVRRWAEVSQLAQPTALANDSKVAAPLDQSNRLLAILGRNLREAFADPQAPAEPQLSDQLRQYGQDPFVLSEETAKAIEAVRALTPNKPMPPLFLWSGDGNPDKEARVAVAKTGARALGGGATTLGASMSVSGLSPFLLADGPQVHVYHALPGDLGNSGYPSKDEDALQGLALLVAQTDVPLRLKPFQLAYSAGSANQFVARSVIERLKRMAVSTKTIPIFAQRYVEIVEGFASVKFRPEGVLTWRITDRGGLQTIRFDGAQALSLNLAESEGTLGARRINGSLYIALDPGVVDPLVALTHVASPSGMTVPLGRVGIVESNLEVVSLWSTDCATTLEVTGWGQGEISFYGDPGARYLVSALAGAVQSNGGVLAETQVTADLAGFATVSVPTRNGKVETVTLRQRCAG